MMTIESTLHEALLTHALATADQHAVDAQPLRDRVWSRLRAAGWAPSLTGTKQHDKLRPASDDILARRMAAGDGASFETLYRRHAGQLLGYARRQLPNGQADDAVQETFLVLLDKAQDVQPGKGKAFLFGVLRKKILKAQVRTARTEVISDEEVARAVDVDDEARDAQRRKALVQLIEANCSLLEQELLALYIEGHSGPEIAKRLGLSSGNVRVRLHRARQRVQAALAEEPP